MNINLIVIISTFLAMCSNKVHQNEIFNKVIFLSGEKVESDYDSRSFEYSIYSNMQSELELNKDDIIEGLNKTFNLDSIQLLYFHFYAPSTEPNKLSGDIWNDNLLFHFEVKSTSNLEFYSKVIKGVQFEDQKIKNDIYTWFSKQNIKGYWDGGGYNIAIRATCNPLSNDDKIEMRFFKDYY